MLAPNVFQDNAETVIKALSLIPRTTPVTVHSDGDAGTIVTVPAFGRTFTLTNGTAWQVERGLPRDAWDEHADGDTANTTAADVLAALGVEPPPADAAERGDRWFVVKILSARALGGMFANYWQYVARKDGDAWIVVNQHTRDGLRVTTDVAKRALKAERDPETGRAVLAGDKDAGIADDVAARLLLLEAD